jgi:hypothetical protein
LWRAAPERMMRETEHVAVPRTDEIDRMVRQYAAALGLDRDYSTHSVRATLSGPMTTRAPSSLSRFISSTFAGGCEIAHNSFGMMSTTLLSGSDSGWNNICGACETG